MKSTLAEEWANRFAQVVESMTGEPPAVTVAAAGSAPSLDPDLYWWEQEFSGIPGAKAWVGASAQAWREIGGKVLSAAGVDEGTAEDLKSTYQEVLNQALAGLSQLLSSQIRREVNCVNGKEEMPPASGADHFAVTVRMGEGDSILSVALSEAIQNPGKKEEAPKAETKKPKAMAAAATAAAGVPESPAARSLDLLLDVELPVSVSFGRAQLPLKDVIKLTTGSIVELNRNVSEPVEIIVNNCVIARGQVVVVEGYFGVRVQQVISRQERLRTLK